MLIRLFSFSVLLSTVTLCLLCIAWLVAGFTNPCAQHLNLNHQWHIGLDSRGIDARMEIFSGSYGPYSGGITSVAGPHGQLPDTPRVLGFGDTLGVYFRRVPIPSGGYWWTLSLSLAYPLVLAAILPSVWVLRHRKRTSLRRGFPVERSSKVEH
jgi:hypothetical protein